MIDISIIIPTYNRNDLLTSCITSVIKNVACNYEIIVVNDYKLSDVKLTLENENIRVINNPKQGVASARNFGAKHALSSILLFIDDDMIIRDFAVDKVVEYITENRKSTYNADWIYPPDVNAKFIKTKFGKYLNSIEFTSLQGMNKDVIKEWDKDSLLDGKAITSQFLGVSKALFDSLNGYKENYPFAGFEDYDLSQRLENNDINFIIDTTVCLYHNELDRLTPKNFMLRRRRGSVSRRFAVNDGYTELILHYGFLKNTTLKVLSYFESSILKIVQLFPNIYPFDLMYKKSMNILIAINIYIGYTTKIK